MKLNCKSCFKGALYSKMHIKWLRGWTPPWLPQNNHTYVSGVTKGVLLHQWSWEQHHKFPTIKENLLLSLAGIVESPVIWGISVGFGFLSKTTLLRIHQHLPSHLLLIILLLLKTKSRQKTDLGASTNWRFISLAKGDKLRLRKG